MAQFSRRRPGRIFSLLRLLIAGLILAAGLMGYRACGLPWPGGRAAARFPVTLVRVVDGDTFRVRDGGGTELKVRLIGIDADELGTAQSFRCALFAAEQLEAAAQIELEPEPGQPTDKYGRTLAWVWITDRGGDTTLLQEEIIRAGLADLYRDAKGSKYFGRLELARRL